MQLITEAYRSSKSQLELLLAEFGLTAMQYGILTRVSEEPEITGAELARQVLVSPQAVQVQLSSLESRHLIKRRKTHGSKIGVVISRKGQEVLQSALPVFQSMQQDLLANFTPAEREALDDLLDLYVKALQGRQGSAPSLTK